MRRDVGRTGHVRLGPPTVVNEPPPGPPFLPRLEIVAYKQATLGRITREQRGPTSRLSPPARIGDAIRFYGPKQWLAEPRSEGDERQRRGLVRLSPPTVIGGAITYGGPGTRLVDPTSPRDVAARPAKSVLRPPAVVDQPVVPPLFLPRLEIVAYEQATLARAHSRLGRGGSVRWLRPTVVTIARAPVGPRVRYVGATERAWRVRYHRVPLLHAPVAVRPPHLFFGPRVKIVSSAAPRLRRTRYTLFAPILAAAEAFVAPPLRLALARTPSSGFRSARSAYLGPAVVAVGEILGGTLVSLARTPPPTVRSRLAPPSVVTQERPQASLGPRVRLVGTSARRTFRSLSRLLPPAVVGQEGLFIGPRVALAPSRRPTVQSLLQPPAVVGAGIRFQGIEEILARSAELPRRKTTVRLAPPAFVRAEGVFFGPSVVLAPTVAKRGLASRLAPPMVIGRLRARGGVMVSLARTPRTVTASALGLPVVTERAETPEQTIRKALARQRVTPPVVARLAPPVVVHVAVEIYGPSVTLARAKPQPTRTNLAAPVVVRLAVEIFGPRVSLTRIRPARTLFEVRAPLVVRHAVEIYGPRITLVRIVPPPTQHVLRKPVVIDLRPQVVYLSVTLTRIRPVPTTTRLAPPTDIVGPEDVGRVRITLAPSRRPITKSLLRGPVVVRHAVEIYGPQTRLARIVPPPVSSVLRAPRVVHVAVEIFGPRVTLAKSKPQPTTTALRPPVVIDLRPQTQFLSLTLAPSTDIPRRRRPDSRLEPPAVVQPRTLVFFGPKVELAPSLRGLPKSVLVPPAVVGPGIYYRGILVRLAYSRRGAPKSVLRAPAVVGRRPFAPVSVHLAPSRRPKTVSRLFPPVIPPLAPPITRVKASLTALDTLRRPARAVLGRPQAVREAFRAAPVAITLAPSARGVAKSLLLPPAVVFFAPHAPIALHLAPSTRGRTLSRLLPPAVVGIAPHAPIRVTFARTITPPTRAFLIPPAVVGDNERYFGPAVHLARITPPPTLSRLRPPAVIIEACYGRVTGFDFGPEVHGYDYAHEVLGGDGATGEVSGADIGHEVKGTTAPGASVSGGDEQREGC